jgi:hypothetical protein
VDLNDPFGRLRRRDEAAFEQLRARLADAGITEPEAIEAVLRRAQRRASVFAAIIIIAAIVLSLTLPALAPVVLAAAALALAVTAKSVLHGRQLLRRAQELTRPPSDDPRRSS